MIAANFTFTQLDLAHNDSEVVLTDPSALSEIREILSRSKRIDGTLETLQFAEMKKLRLVNDDPADSRVYIVDLRNGYATILSKSVMPVYSIADIERFNQILIESSTLNPNAG